MTGMMSVGALCGPSLAWREPKPQSPPSPSHMPVLTPGGGLSDRDFTGPPTHPRPPQRQQHFVRDPVRSIKQSDA
jgi:hypothetical protein